MCLRVVQHPGCLSGKGPHIKDIVRAIYAVRQAHCYPELHQHKLVLVVLENQCLLQDNLIYCRDEMSLGLGLATQLAKHVDTVLINDALLADLADEQG